MRSIRERPAEAEGREVPGHWEGDLIKGTFHGRAIGTLVDRSSRYVILVRVDEATAESVLEGFTRRLRTLPQALRQTLTKTQGKETARHRDWNSRRGFAWFACPHSSWQRPRNESPNGLLRQYFPRGTGASEYLQRTLT
jgi:IS30 family transposase